LEEGRGGKEEGEKRRVEEEVGRGGMGGEVK
jgi:hypothetical protein